MVCVLGKRRAAARVPRASVDTALRTGLSAAATDRESAVAVPDALSTAEEEFVGPGDAVLAGPRVVKNAATFRRAFKLHVVTRPDDPSAFNKPVDSAMRHAEAFAVEFGFVRCSSRAARRCTWASLFARGYPRLSTGPAWLAYRAFSSKRLQGHLAAQPHGLLPGCVDWEDSSGAP